MKPRYPIHDIWMQQKEEIESVTVLLTFFTRLSWWPKNQQKGGPQNICQNDYIVPVVSQTHMQVKWK